MLGPFDKDYFSALLLLLPGFVSWQVMSYFGGTLVAAGGFEIVAACLAYSLVNFLFALGVAAPFGHKFTSPLAATDGNWRPTPGFAALLLIVAVLTGSATAWVDRSGIVYQLAPTARISHARPWVKLFESCRPAWAQVITSTGARYMGFVHYFSDSSDETELVLSRVHSVADDGERTPLKAARLLLFGKDIRSVELYPVGDGNPCAVE
jgi:hypothetical protein